MTASQVLFALALLGAALVAVQVWVLRRHARSPRQDPREFLGISILKPLCGKDEGLWENLEVFASLDYPLYEVLLGVRDRTDPAWEVARAAVARWPSRFRLVVQRGEPGLNPKVNQLITLERSARHELLVISDSNVRVRADYLREIAWHLEAEEVGLVTHPIVGVGERSAGAFFDNLHLAANVSPGMVTAKRLGGRDVVVGKSMAFRRSDLERLGGFECVKDVLAEDYVLGVKIWSVLGKRVAIAASPVENLNCERAVGEFLGRYTRWCVMQRMIAGPALYGSQILLNPVVFAAAAAALAPCWASGTFFLAVCALKAILDEAAVRTLRGSGFRWHRLVLVPVKDLLFALAWVRGFLENSVVWRGNRLRVLPGSALARPGRKAAGSIEDVEGALATDS
ncbi:MAG TPA: ceramide glucosyltransferase [Anaeromyxobacteraceae bacterium]|nr:ceramide glucosyltransferase [Anaeromyxobacteraceae bacterium]